MFFGIQRLGRIAMVLSLLAVSSNATHAAFSLTISGVANAIVDNGIGDTDLTLGRIVFDNSGPVGYSLPGVFTTFTIDSTSNAPGTPASAFLTSSQVNLVAGSAVPSLTVIVTDEFSLPGSAGDMLGVFNSITANLNVTGSPANSQASASQDTLVDGIGVGAVNVHVQRPFPPGPITDGDASFGSLLRAGSTFTFQTLISLSNLSAGVNVTFDHQSSAQAGPPGDLVPEPASVMIWAGLACCVVGLTMFRNGRRQAS